MYVYKIGHFQTFYCHIKRSKNVVSVIFYHPRYLQMSLWFLRPQSRVNMILSIRRVIHHRIRKFQNIIRMFLFSNREDVLMSTIDLFFILRDKMKYRVLPCFDEVCLTGLGK